MSIESDIERVFNIHHIEYDGPLSFGATFFDFKLGNTNYEIVISRDWFLVNQLTPTLALSNVYRKVYSEIFDSSNFSNWLMNQAMIDSCK